MSFSWFGHASMFSFGSPEDLITWALFVGGVLMGFLKDGMNGTRT